MAAATTARLPHNLVPLRSWLDIERAKQTTALAAAPPQQIGPTNDTNNERRKKVSIIRRTTVAYGISELLKCANNTTRDEDIHIDNFVVRVSKKTTSLQRTWDDIKGVGMMSSGVSLTIEEPSYLSSLLLEGEEFEDELGRCLEVQLSSEVVAAADICSRVEESNRCYLFARLMYEILTHEPFPYDDLPTSAASTEEPDQKKAKTHQSSSRKKLMLSRAKGDFDKVELTFQIPPVMRMQEMGIPSSLCLMAQNLLESPAQSYDAYESMGEVCDDLHLLLLDPDRFLFDAEVTKGTGDMPLLYRKGKLYGRDREECLITDAFCRVSRGNSEAFFIGGFSGSGKSMLVNSLIARVNVVGGFVIKHKFDAISQESQLAGVISAFNQMCQMMKARYSPRRLVVITNKLRDKFGVDFRLLVRLLPSVSEFFPEFVSPETGEQDGDTMNIFSVRHTLLRFVRIVSSPVHPIVLFLDDIQWADSTALDVIHTILSDTMGSCVLFIGSYRDNEVQVDHDLFDLMEKLEISNVPTTKVYLTGLDQENLNTMISDALCLYPRICKSLSDIVLQKTEGNPFFVLEFMQSLQGRGLLQYNFHQKRWVWNEDIIRAEEITDNVLYLLSSKMNGLSEDVRILLKVMACFGTSTHDSVIGYLSESAEYSGVRDGLERAVGDGFVEKHGDGNFKFVHDKIREAAYNLISDDDKMQFHYNLGQILHSVCEGRDVGNTILLIADLINHGKEFITKDEKEPCIAIAKLNMKAGKKAIDGCDHKAAYSYLQIALSLLPDDHWESQYDFSLRLNFLMASAANSSCKVDVAELIVRRIFKKARCLEDKLPSYFLICRILIAQNKVINAYNTCSSILAELGESIPDSMTPQTSKTMVAETLSMYMELYNDAWLQKKMEDTNQCNIVKFYRLIAFSSFFCKSPHMTVYFGCRALQLSLRNGISEDAVPSLIDFASIAITDDNNAVFAFHIAKNAMSLLERFDVADQIPMVYCTFYGSIAWRFAPLRSCTDELRRGFEIGLSCGNAVGGFYCAIEAMKCAFYSGENLVSMLKEIDYYLQLSKTYGNNQLTKNYLLNFRETISTLIDKGQETSIEEVPSFRNGDIVGESTALFHKAIRAYWLGYTERCNHFIKNCLPLIGPSGRHNSCVMKFYLGLNSLDMVEKNVKCSINKDAAIEGINAVRYSAAKYPDWTSKLYLLEAEQHAIIDESQFENRLQSISYCISYYDASIACAKISKFIHEEGLACEKAGFYCKKKRDVRNALMYFHQARHCYSEWGSSMKADFIQNEINNLSLQLPPGHPDKSASSFAGKSLV